MARRILIVGGVAGGASAAARLRRLDESLDIVVFERGPHVSFANCGLPYFLGGEIATVDKLLVQTPERLHKTMRLDVRILHEVIRIDPDQRIVHVRELNTGIIRQERYDELILSTGAKPIWPNIPHIDRPGHFVLRNIPDMLRIDEWIRTSNAQNAVVVGGGFIGLEVAEQLSHRGMSVTLVQNTAQVLAPMDPEMVAPVHEELRKHGIELILNDGLTGFEPIGETSSFVLLQSGRKLPADVVVMGLGVRPEIGLAKDAGLTIGERGGIRVDEHLRTSDPHIYAIGDAIEVRDGATGEWALIALAGPANRQGRIVADNIVGRPSVYRSTWGTAIVRVFGLTAACTGANEKTLKRLNRPYQALYIHPNSHAGYYPGAKQMALKIIFDPNTGKLLGAQAVGEDGIDKRIDVLATALKAGMTIDDLADLELAYAPPYGSAKDPINMAGMAAQNVRNGDVTLVQWHEVPHLLAQGAIVLDVRDAREREQGAIPNSHHIPLPELRDRLKELPRDREILAHCQTGQRSYNACRILQQHGFRCRNLTGSYRTWKMAHPGENA